MNKSLEYTYLLNNFKIKNNDVCLKCNTKYERDPITDQCTCLNCGEIWYMYDRTPELSYQKNSPDNGNIKENVGHTQNNTNYKRLVFAEKYIRTVLNKINIIIPESVIIKIKKIMKSDRIQSNSILFTIKYIREILSKIDKKNNPPLLRIYQIITGKNLLEITNEQIKIMLQIFNKLQQPIDKYLNNYNTKRKNFIPYKFIFKKILDLMSIKVPRGLFEPIAGNNNLNRLENIWLIASKQVDLSMYS